MLQAKNACASSILKSRTGLEVNHVNRGFFACRVQAHTCSSTSAFMEKMNVCMDPKLQTGLVGIFSEIALNDQEGECLDKETIFYSYGTVRSGTKCLQFCIIDYMLLKMC